MAQPPSPGASAFAKGYGGQDGGQGAQGGESAVAEASAVAKGYGGQDGGQAGWRTEDKWIAISSQQSAFRKKDEKGSRKYQPSLKLWPVGEK